jgi:PfaD family protein
VAKVSRLEVAEAFLRPAPAVLLRKLMESGDISADAAHLAAMVPMADDITVEADSGGHTDRRPLLVALPEIMALRDRIAGEFPAAADVRIGAAGGIGTPAAAAAAFGLGAAYVVTGSINQASVEAGTSAATKELLATAGSADCVMAPSSDMFEMGVQVQVLRRGTMFAGRAAQLYDVYRAYESIDAIPQKVREGLERDIFRRPLQSVWDECVRYFNERDPDQIAAADNNPRRRMALVFRWYLGLSSGWSINGDDTRTADYQVWCGPAMGAFNSWAAGTHLASARNRRAVDIADHIMTGAAFHTRINSLRSAGVHFPPQCATYWPSL